MSFNRLKYDNCETKKYNQESVGVGNYLYDTPIMCNNCYNDNPRVINQKNGVSINSNVDWRFYHGPVDIESELFNINKAASRCQDNNDFKNSLGKPNNLVNFPNCFFTTEDTRLNNSAQNLRSTGWNRFDPLIFNPQEKINYPGLSMVPTRIIVKDNHRPSIVVPNVNSMDPNEQLRPCPMINDKLCGNYTQPLYQYDVCG
jgi:hypothetical protein